MVLARVTQAQSDTVSILTFREFLEIVRIHHPLSLQAELQPLIGNATLRQSQGAFDPEAYGQVSQKYFDGEQYYSLINGGLKIPTWFGMELKAAYDRNSGTYVNPENNVPEAGLWYAGLSMPLGRGLFIDKRRAALRQAQIYKESTVVERQIMLNDLLYEAGKSYWDWFAAFNKRQIYLEALALANQRFEAVKQGANFGDRPAIDTLEAGIQVQSRQVSLQQANLEFENAGAFLSIYLWDSGIIPLELAEGTQPVLPDSVFGIEVDTTFYLQLSNLTTVHPELRQSRFKIDQLEIERRLKQEMLKPKLNFNYNALSEPVNGDPFADYSISNYKWGVEFSMPLFLRQERGDLQLAKLKIQDAEFDLTAKNAAIVYKALAALNFWRTTKAQADIYTRTVRDYAGLLDGERQMFDAGESSLFMVNARETGYVNAQVEMIDILAKNRKAELTTRFMFGILSQP